MKKILTMLIACFMLAGLLAGCNGGDKDPQDTKSVTVQASDTPPLENTPTGPRADAGIEGIDFSNGNIDFLFMYSKPVDASPDAKLELAQYQGTSAAKITPAAGKVPYVVIDASGLLGSNVSNVATVEIGIAAERSGKFEAVSGEILVFKDWKQENKKGSWSVFMENKNPNIAAMTLDAPFGSGDGNLFVLNLKTDNGLSEGGSGTTANFYITRIGFKDAGGAWLDVNADASFTPIEGFNDMGAEFIVELGDFVLDANKPDRRGWLTDGTDSFDGSVLPYTTEEFNKAAKLVLELSEPLKGIPILDEDKVPTGEVAEPFIQLVWLSDVNQWDWQQEDITVSSTETTFEFDLYSIFSGFEVFGQSDQMKFFVGYFKLDEERGRNTGAMDDFPLTRAYFVCYES